MNGRRVPRLLALMTAAVVALVGAQEPASAHGGETVFSDEAGPYRVEATDSVVRDQALLYTLYLRDLRRGLPVDDAKVTLTASAGDTTVTPRSNDTFGNAYQFLIPDPGERMWNVQVEVDGRLGAVSFEHSLEGVGYSGPWWTSPVLQVVLWALVGAAAMRLLWRERQLRGRKEAQAR